MSLGLILITPMASGFGQTVTSLQCEYLVNPIGVDTDHPRLSWMLQDSTRGAAQSAYRIVVGTDSSAVSHQLANTWDSKKTLERLNLVTMPGSALKPFTKYYWTVLVWNQLGKPLAPGRVATFETGMMDMRHWQGSWISDGDNIQTLEAPYFRKVFTTTKAIQSARAYIAAAGLYELSLNGTKVGDHRLDPMYTRFDRRNFYVTYDITTQLKQGPNSVGVLLGNGWYNHQSLAVWNFDRAPWRARPVFCLDIKITYTDGTTQTITSDQSWKTHTGPLVFNSIYTGEHYDARKEIPGWNTVNYVDTAWRRTILRAAPSKNIVSQLMSPIKNVLKIPVQSMTRFSDTNYVFDLGQNIAGVTQVRLNGEEGTIVRIKHGERLQKDNHVDMSNIDVYYRPVDDSDPYGTDIVILNGQGPIDFMPKFNYKGFQYVEISSSRPIALTKEDVTGWFMHSDVTPVGSIDCSNPIINKLWWATNNSYLSNLFGYPTDCPQREKNGWTGDGHFAVETGLFNFDGITIYEKWMADHRDEQQPNGVLPDIIPTGGWGYGTANGTDWTSTIAIIPWNLYLFYGDKKPLQDNYLAIKQYLKYVESISPAGLTTFGRGDWVPVKSTSPLEYTSSIYYYVDVTILAKSARLFGNSEDEKYYTALALKIKKAINDKYFNSATNIYGSGLQTEMSMALQWGIVPPELKSKVAANLATRVKSDGMHLDVGVLGAKAILNALSDNGQAATAYALAAQDSYPSWGWWIKNGATTLYENWNIQAARDISLNHMMFGEIGAWFFKGLGGIHPDEANPGFKNILLSPHFVSQLSHFTASHRGPFGTILSSWQRLGDSIKYSVTIPANSTATVEFDLTPGQQIILDHKQIPAKISLSSGTYLFMIK
ncbi:MAG: family 78 glycoside hydrolase catalytic domain [Saprospiraceae bacterium]